MSRLLPSSLRLLNRRSTITTLAPAARSRFAPFTRNQTITHTHPHTHTVYTHTNYISLFVVSLFLSSFSPLRSFYSASIRAMSSGSSSSPVAAPAAPAPVGTPAAVKPLYNPGLPHYDRPRAMLDHMLSLTREHDLIRNYVGVIEDMSLEHLSIETDLFPMESLTFYSRYNLLLLDLDTNPHDRALHAKYYTPARGGGQGDYREGCREKIANVISSLKQFPNTKRAVFTVPFTHHGSITADHTDTDEAKCLRELHFYLDGPAEGPRKLSCTGCMRAQAASIFPKNIHFIGTMMHHIAKELGVEVGTYTHQVTTLVDVR